MYWKESRGTANAPRRKFRADNIIARPNEPEIFPNRADWSMFHMGRHPTRRVPAADTRA